MMKRNVSISRKISFAFLLLVVATVTSVGSISFYYGSGIIEERITSQLQSIVSLKENQFEDFIFKEEEYLETIAKNKDLINHLSEDYLPYETTHDNDEHEKVRVLLEDTFRATRNDFIEFFSIDNAGIVSLSTKVDNEGKIKSNEQYFIEGKKNTFVQSFYYDLSLQESSIIISTPVYQNDTELGVLVGRLNLDVVSDIMNQREGLGETGETYFVNQYHYLVTASRFEKGLEFKKTIYTQAVENCLNGTSGESKYKDYRNVDVIGVYRWIPNRQVCLIAKFDREEVFQSINHLRTIIIIFSIGIIFLSWVLGFLFSRSVTNPIKELRDAAVKIGEGDFYARIKRISRDELGDLAMSFNKMVIALKKSHEELRHQQEHLENTVAQRTKELESKNEELEKFNTFFVDRELKMIELKEQIKKLKEK